MTYSPPDRIGREVSAASYWSEATNTYIDVMSSDYHRERLRMVASLCEKTGPVNVDFGCGDGALFPILDGLVLACDPAHDMVDAAAARHRGQGRVAVGGVEWLATVETASVDLLVSANVLAYLTDEEAGRFYEEATRVVKRGGALVVTHSNELFDLFALNRFTVTFFNQQFACNAADIAPLLANAALPERPSYNVRANPLSYRFFLDEHGFTEVRQEFFNFHPAPPQLAEAQALSSLDVTNDLRWKWMMQCSTYGSRSVRQ